MATANIKIECNSKVSIDCASWEAQSSHIYNRNKVYCKAYSAKPTYIKIFSKSAIKVNVTNYKFIENIKIECKDKIKAILVKNVISSSRIFCGSNISCYADIFYSNKSNNNVNNKFYINISNIIHVDVYY